MCDVYCVCQSHFFHCSYSYFTLLSLAVSRIQLVRYPSDDKIVRFKEISPTLSDKQDSQQKLMEKHSHNLFSNPNTFMDNKHHRNACHKISVCKSCYTDYRYQQRFQSSRSQMSPIHFLNPQGYISEFLVPLCHPTSMSLWFAVCPKTHRNNTYTLDTGAVLCSKCFLQINNFSFHSVSLILMMIQTLTVLYISKFPWILNIF